MKNLIIWWHRRRAANHGGKSAGNQYPLGCPEKTRYHNFWQNWHLEQIKRLQSNVKP